MPKQRLTQGWVERQRAPHASGKTTFFWDTELTGFGLRISGSTARKTYVVQYELSPEAYRPPELKPGENRRGRKPKQEGLSARKTKKRSTSDTIGPTNVFDIEDARDRARQILSIVYAGKNPKPHRRGCINDTLRTWVERYLEYNNRINEGTRAEYRATFGTNEKSQRGYLKSWLDKPLREITPAMVSARHREIRAKVVAAAAEREKKARRQELPAPANKVTVNGKSAANGAMRALSVVWNFATKRLASEGVADFPSNPVKRLEDDRSWHKIPRRMRDVSFDDLPKFYAAVQALPNIIAREYIMFLLFTGTRRQEAAGLRWEDLHFSKKEIRFPAARTKAARLLALPMTDVVFDLLMARRGNAEGDYIFPASGKDKVTGKYADKKGNPILVPIAEPKFAFGQIYKATGIYASPHDLRRTFISVAVDAGVSGYHLKALVNHALSDADVTEGYVSSVHLREPAQRVADRLKELCKIEAVPNKLSAIKAAAS